MAKSPRKGNAAGQKSSAVSNKLNPKSYKPAKVGGKNFKAYNNIKPNRRMSIASSTSSESSNGNSKRRSYASASDSESSLTAMSEEDENTASRKGSVFFAPTSDRKKPARKTNARNGKTVRTLKKGIASKSAYKSYPASYSSDDADSDDDSQHILNYQINDDDEDEQEVGLNGIYSMIDNSGNDSASDSDSNSPDDENEVSSSDDSEVDFVQLQAERRAKSMKNLKAIKGVPKAKASADATPKPKRRRSSLYRRRSEVALPEDINFKFEFNDTKSGSVIDEEDEEDDDITGTVSSKYLPGKQEEEDIGEEIVGAESPPLLFHFDEPLLDVPKFKDEDVNSEDDYEFDDNDLLATLQADNDLEEFITTNATELTPRTRQGSLSSVNEDENEDLFLKEEEKYLVNEFETNGFDDDEVGPVRLETARVMDSFQESGDTSSQNKQVLQYVSSSDNSDFGSDEEDSKQVTTFNDANDDVDDYIDVIDFDAPFFENSNSEGEKTGEIAAHSSDKKKTKSKSHFPKQKIKRKGPLDSEEEDDSYLWNYFFSDAESNSESEKEVDVEEQFVLEEIFRKDLEEKQGNPVGTFDDVVSEAEYDSGESTDVDMTLPSASTNNLGSKLAKEVLSSKTADYRPPVLGTWIAIESKPFGIIDGLSTRTLNSQTSANNPRTKNWRNFSIKNDLEDLAIELDELLNISELDNDDENDVRIWRDFNNNKKHVPLGAFRNKAHIKQPVVVPEPMGGFSVSKMNTSHKNRRTSVRESSKLKRRKASVTDAVSGGYRPTKSGLFSENVLADVEEVLGDDKDIMALIKGL